MMKGLTDIPGIRVGHASDFEGVTGCTAILCDSGAAGGIDSRGAATGLEDPGLLDPLHVTGRIHAVVFAGGSAFGLEAASGVRRYLEQKGVGLPTTYGKIPLVTGAILYDLGIGKASVRPTREMGEAAAAAATDRAVAEGSVGAGTGATCGKVYGMERAMKGGVGTFTVALGGPYAGVLVSALAVVNAWGDVIDPAANGKVVAGARKSKDSREFAGSAEAVKGGAQSPFRGGNTTLVAVATNAVLSKVQATKLAQLAQHGMVRTISPVHSTADGDTVIALSVGERLQADINALGVAAAEAVSAAILRAVRQAKGLGGVPGLAG